MPSCFVRPITGAYLNPTSKNPKSIADALGPKLVAKLVKLVKLVSS